MSPQDTLPIALMTLSIRNFRGIESLDLDFRGPDGQPNRLAVLAGPNGCGKTAVLEAALLAVGGHELAVGARGERAIRKGAEDYEVRLVFRDLQKPFVGTIERTDTARSHPRQRMPDLPFWYFSSWRAPNLVGAVDVIVGKRGQRPEKNDPDRLWNVKEQLATAAVAESFPGAGQPVAAKYHKWMDRLNESWARFYPNSSDRFAVGLADPEAEGVGAFEVFFIREGRPRLSVDDLSAGQLELFLFLAALVLNDDREGIVFIDEPELHLDPQWHAPMLRTLMSLQPRAQFLIATHSPSIYESASSFERHFLVPDDDPRAAIWGQVQQARN